MGNRGAKYAARVALDIPADAHDCGTDGAHESYIGSPTSKGWTREQGDRGLDRGVFRSSSRMYGSCLASLGSGQTRSAIPLILSIVIHTVGNLDGFLGPDHCYG